MDIICLEVTNIMSMSATLWKLYSSSTQSARSWSNATIACFPRGFQMFFNVSNLPINCRRLQHLSRYNMQSNRTRFLPNPRQGECWFVYLRQTNRICEGRKQPLSSASDEFRHRRARAKRSRVPLNEAVLSDDDERGKADGMDQSSE